MAWFYKYRWIVQKISMTQQKIIKKFTLIVKPFWMLLEFSFGTESAFTFEIFWSFLNSPNILNLHVFQGCYGQKPKKLEIRKYVNLSQPWNLTFLENEIFQLFFQSDDPKVPEWKIAHIEWSEKVHKMRDLEAPTPFHPFGISSLLTFSHVALHKSCI